MIDTYKEWLSNEYQQWTEALNRSSVIDFKDHPMVRRMLSIGMEFPVPVLEKLTPDLLRTVLEIDDIGYHQTPPSENRGDLARMVYYAQKVLERNPLSIVEIGGGVGEFYAIMRALGFEGDYCIMDLADVERFQYRYLQRVRRVTGLKTSQYLNFEFCVSFYALGEFDNETKERYIKTILGRCLHGFILWNPHSGASPKVNFPCTITEEDPLLAEGNKQLEW